MSAALLHAAEARSLEIKQARCPFCQRSRKVCSGKLRCAAAAAVWTDKRRGRRGRGQPAHLATGTARRNATQARLRSHWTKKAAALGIPLADGAA